MNACGSCTACCRVFAIPELKKPAGKWCEHCAVGVGCKVYDARPERCVEFACLWLQSQDNPAHALSPELRPDRCKVVFSPTTNEHILSAITMPGAPDAHRRKLVRELIERLVENGAAVAVGPPGARNVTMFTKAGEHPARLSAPDANGMQWREDV
jgi:hypothetical protein